MRKFWDAVLHARNTVAQEMTDAYWTAHHETFTRAGVDKAMLHELVAEAMDEVQRQQVDLILYGDHTSPPPRGIMRSPVQP